MDCGTEGLTDRIQITHIAVHLILIDRHSYASVARSWLAVNMSKVLSTIRTAKTLGSSRTVAASQTSPLRARKFGDAETLAIGARGEAGRAFEQPSKESRVFVANSPADLIDRSVGPLEPAFGIFDA